MIGAFFLLILLFFFFMRGNTKGIVAIVIISLINDKFLFSIGFSLPVHYMISLLCIPTLIGKYKFVSPQVKRIIAPLYVELFYLILLAIFFGFVFPWESRYDYQRSWGQKAGGRAIIQVFRLFAEFSLVFVIYFWLYTKKITLDYLLKSIAIIISITVIFTLIDTLLGSVLKQFFFSESRNILDRFTGLNDEPRSFGRVCSFVLLLLISFKSKNKNTVINLGILFSIIGIAISLSASTYLLTFIWALVFTVITKRFNYLIFGVTFIFVALFFLNQNDFFRENTLKKIEYVMSGSGESDQKEKVYLQEPEIFGSFEIFDRAALNFLYIEPFYILTGTGPNLISIPSSPYITESSYSIYGDRIDSVPHSFLVNLISRSGIIGLIMWIVFICRFKNALRNFQNEKRALFICAVTSYFIIDSSIFLLLIAILFYIIQEKLYFITKNKK